MDLLHFWVAEEGSEGLDLLNLDVGEREWLKMPWRRREREQENIFFN